jgi:hypothetical protein
MRNGGCGRFPLGRQHPVITAISASPRLGTNLE